MTCAQIPRVLGPHSAGMGVVVAMHVLLALALMQDVPRTIMKQFKPPIVVQVLKDFKAPEQQLAGLPKPRALTRPLPPPLALPDPLVKDAEVTEQPTIPTASGGFSLPEAHGATSAGDTAEMLRPSPSVPSTSRIAARPAIGSVQGCAPRSDDYPQAARRAEVSGTTRLRFTVSAAGRLVRSEVIKSAGTTREHRLLDKVAEEKLAGCNFTAGIDEEGKAVGGTFEVEYVWRLEY